MGIFDKISKALQGAVPDYDGIIRGLMGSSQMYGYTQGMSTVSSKMDSSYRGSITGIAMNMAIDKAHDSISKKRHISGDPGSWATRIPAQTRVYYVASSPDGLVFMNFGETGTDADGVIDIAVPRNAIASIAQQGTSSKGWGMFRLTFIDGSWVDFQLGVHDLAVPFFQGIGIQAV